MKPFITGVIILTIFGLGLFFIQQTFMTEPPFSVQEIDVKKQVESTSIDHLLAEDLALSTSIFIHQLSEQLQRWSEQDFSDRTYYENFKEELTEHPHFQSFAIVEDDRIIVQAGALKDIDPNELTHRHHKSLFSDPYNVDSTHYMMIGETLSNNRIVIGEVDLTFIQNYMEDLASIADTNGSFFISGNNPDVEWQTTDELPDNLQSETVPELGWEIFVHSDHKTLDLEREYIEHQAVIKFRDKETASIWFADQPELTILENKNPLFLIESKQNDTIELINRLKNDRHLAIVEPNYTLSKQISTIATPVSTTRQLSNVEPNDEFFKPYQWNLNQIEVEQGWNFSNGEQMKIAILDTGVDPNHSDLKDKLINGYNALDDSDDFNDTHGHGTHVAGIAAALTNNVTGIAGVSWDSYIIPIKVLNEEGEGSSYEVAKGIYWAVDHGANVINMSLGDYHSSDLLYDAIRYAYEQDVVLIAASGNDNVEDPMYPARYPEVLTVAAVNDKRNRAFFSNFGYHIDVTAPGEHIPSLFPNDHYVVMSGTSMAAPHVSGLAALLRSNNPELSNDDIYQIITNTSTDLGTKGYDPYYGYGEIDVNEALRSVHQ
ncbi:S8 family peptidase [Alkalihalobacillus hemicellulosilyticus]|uniref:Protease n=1 Tax=Halalkalibacter hemicellulosilyticusJCM 9152 TaxID=1236971 RepID=W4QHH8_9BACI|nr:S8 family peptidase [Halalkalibacter hemicellulosilyticus]GAE30794.1 protease [Halalkalibacter hemicellulosilyticusJCM 9152]